LRTNASITVLVNNAGIAMSGDLSSADPDRLESMIRLNVLAPSRLALAAIWEKSGTGIASLPPSIVMDVDDMVDAALSGLDRGETVTIPSLPDVLLTVLPILAAR
jgi:short-subunit dehydrogenase